MLSLSESRYLWAAFANRITRFLGDNSGTFAVGKEKSEASGTKKQN
jgi:hypothetical protein